MSPRSSARAVRPSASALRYSARSAWVSRGHGPVVERGARRGDGAVHVRRLRLRGPEVDLLGGGLDHVERRVRRRRDPLAADEELVRVADRRPHLTGHRHRCGPLVSGCGAEAWHARKPERADDGLPYRGPVDATLHLSLPVDDLAAARRFYEDGLGCRVGRVRDEWIDVWFFGLQLTLQTAPMRCGRLRTRGAATSAWCSTTPTRSGRWSRASATTGSSGSPSRTSTTPRS